MTKSIKIKNSSNLNMDFQEFPDIETCKSIYLHKDISPADRLPLMLYCKQAIDNGKVFVSYKKKKYGRYYSDSYSCSVMNSKIRATLFNKSEHDIDIKNCHFEILKQMCIDNGFKCKLIKNYCNNRLKIIEDSSVDLLHLNWYNKQYNKSCSKRDVIKHLFTILLFGGSITTFQKKYKLTTEQYSIGFDVDALQKEIKKITKKILELNDNKKIITWLISDKRKQAETTYADKFDEVKFKVKNSKKLSYILQEKETEIVLNAIDLFKKCGVKVSSYIYDGFQIIKSSVSEYELRKILKMVWIWKKLKQTSSIERYLTI